LRTAKILSLIGILLFLYALVFSYIRFYQPWLLTSFDESVFLRTYPIRNFDVLMFVEMWVIYPLIIVGFIGIILEMEWGRLLIIQSSALMITFDIIYILRISKSVNLSPDFLITFSLSYIPFLFIIFLTLVIIYLIDPLFKEKITTGVIPPGMFFKENIKEVYFKIHKDITLSQ